MARLLTLATAFVATHGLRLTPIGPFSPFRSAACADGSPLGSAMAGLTQSKMPAFAMEMSKLQLEMQANPNGMPDLPRIRRLASDLSDATDDWGQMLARMSLVDDFQAREYYKMTSVWAEKQGESLATIGLMMRWQADSMLAFADGKPPLPPPPGVNLEKLARQQQEQQQNGPGSMLSQISAAAAVDATPFTGKEAAFESAVVREEYEKLCRDHAGIVRLGESFGTFDALGKVAFLDQLKFIEERWDVFFSRFALLGALNPDFEAQTSAFLNSMGMDADQFREILDETHVLMREEAEAQR